MPVSFLASRAWMVQRTDLTVNAESGRGEGEREGDGKGNSDGKGECDR